MMVGEKEEEGLVVAEGVEKNNYAIKKLHIINAN